MEDKHNNNNDNTKTKVSLKKINGAPPQVKLLEMLKIDPSFTTETLAVLPKKWERIGDVIILKKLHESLTEDLQHKIGQALLKILKGAQTVIVDEGGIKGELRQPEFKLLHTITQPACDNNTDNDFASFGIEETPTLTIHMENGIKYCLDVLKVMFASGNGTERMHFAKIKAPGEVIVDMFAGIGYFSVPLALYSKHKFLLSIEKNPDSFKFLCKNMAMNQVLNAKPVLGDNRVEGEEVVGKADRVLMGYIPSSKEFLQRAFEFLKPEGGILHYHLTCTKQECEEQLPAKHIEEELAIWNATKKSNWKFAVEEVRNVKPYAPKRFHYVADVRIFVENDLNRNT